MQKSATVQRSFEKSHLAFFIISWKQIASITSWSLMEPLDVVSDELHGPDTLDFHGELGHRVYVN
jgi:hypothetical protein